MALRIERNARMHTLHEYMMITKAHEYLLAVGAMLVFILFWRLVTRQKR